MSNAVSRPFHVLLMRHGSHQAVADGTGGRELSPEGEKEVRDAADRLRGYMRQTPDICELKLLVRKVIYADSDEAAATARLLHRQTWPGQEDLLAKSAILNPDKTSPYDPADVIDRLARQQSDDQRIYL